MRRRNIELEKKNKKLFRKKKNMRNNDLKNLNEVKEK